MVCTTNIAPSYLSTTTIAQHSASIVRMVSDLPSNLRFARNGRLKIFAFVNDSIDDFDELVTTRRIHLGRYLYLWASARLQSRKVQKWLKQRFTCHERNRVHPLQRISPLQTRNCIRRLYVFLIKLSWLCVRTGPLAVKERLIGKSLRASPPGHFI